MTVFEQVAVLLAGMAAGTINAVVGSGTLITFPVLLAIGFEPVVANVSNSVGLWPGSVSGAIGYRAELSGQRDRLVRLGMASLGGGLTGALALLVLPDGAFRAIVPVLIALACGLVVFQPRLAAQLRPRTAPAPLHGGAWLFAGVYGAGVYGGYFGAAQGVLLIAILGLALPDGVQRINAAKNVLAAIVNVVAAVVFVFAADVAWRPAILIAVGSIVGGQLGARIGRRLPPAGLRALIVVVGVVGIVKVLAG